jgi:imidazole glycerol-phosphate synthase subunit HisH
VIAVIDYGMGNLNSIQKALRKIGAESVVTDDPEILSRATHIILPGVGFFGQGMANLATRGMIPILRHELLEMKKPCLGICLGMQLLFTTSEEGGSVAGLDFIKGRIVRFKENGLKVPHIGWNDVRANECAILTGIEDQSNFYFLHSYHAIPDEPVQCGYTNYGYDFVSVVGKGTLFGTQFHPEKSQKKGLQILENFARIPCSR